MLRWLTSWYEDDQTERMFDAEASLLSDVDQLGELLRILREPREESPVATHERSRLIREALEATGAQAEVTLRANVVGGARR